MKKQQKNITHKKYLKSLATWLTILLFLQIGGFFTVSENVAITRVIKVFLRIATTGGVVLLYLQAISKGHVASFIHRNTLAPFLYGCYLFLGFCSLLWSTNPGYSMLQLFMTSISLIFVYYFLALIEILRHYHQTEAPRIGPIFSKSIFWISLIFVVGMFVMPDQFYRMTHGGEVARLGGYMMNPNELGMLGVVGLAAGMLNLKYESNRKGELFMMAVTFFGLVMTGSRSSIISFFLVVMYFITLSNNYKLKASVIIISILSIPVVINTIILKQGDVEEVLSMTGRLPFWKALLNEGIVKEPWFGFGFMRIAYGETFQSVHTYAGKMTHNTFIQVLMNLGFVGFGLVLCQMAVTFRAMFKSDSPYLRSFFIAVLIPIMINSFTEFGIFGENNYGILFYQFLIFLFVLQYQPKLNIVERLQQRKLVY